MACGGGTALHVEVVARDTGHWCRTCLLGSGIRWVLAVTGPVLLTGMSLQEHARCGDCGGRDVEVVGSRGDQR